MGIAGGCLNLKNAIADLQDRNIECATAKVKDHDGLILFLVEAVG